MEDPNMESNLAMKVDLKLVQSTELNMMPPARLLLNTVSNPTPRANRKDLIMPPLKVTL